MSQTTNASRILFVKNVSHKTKGDDMYDLFGKYGGIRQVRMGSSSKTRGTAFVVYDDIDDVCLTALLKTTEFQQAKKAFDSLNGFHLQERYLVVLFHQPAKQLEKDLARREADLEKQKARHGID